MNYTGIINFNNNNTSNNVLIFCFILLGMFVIAKIRCNL